MKWFQGNINEAVTASKSRKAIFVVFIEGKDDASAEISKVIDTDEVSSLLERDDFVAVKVEGGSESYGFFAQIYQLVPIPSLFFIGQNGTPIEVVAGETSAADLASKIDTILKKVDTTSKNSSTSFIQSEQKESAGSSGSPRSSETEVKAIDLESDNKSTTSAAPASATPEQPDNEEVKVESEGNSQALGIPKPEIKDTEVKSEAPTASSTDTEDAKKLELSTEEKMQRARQLIELQKRQRDEEEAKKLREREIERRKTGQELQKIKQKQQDLEIKQAYEERMKEKAAETAAREKVRQQIAQDKLERKQRELDLQQQQQKNSSQNKSSTPEQTKPRSPTSSNCSIARIQFRLPSGNPHTGQFEATSTLGALRVYVLENIELPFRQFALSTSFPRRELTVQDDEKTLSELELTPSAVILILPLKNTNSTTAVTSAQENGYLSSFMWTIFASIVSAFSYIKAYFTGSPPRSTEHQNSDSQSPSPGNQPSTSRSDRPVPQSTGGAALPPGLLRRNIGGQGNPTLRAQSNVHRLHSGGDQDNDENNTWNGNSTQQM